MNYFNCINERLKNYFNVLVDEIPEWLEEYVNTPAMERIGYISMDCGNDYTALFEKHDWHSNLDHSVGVALIIWHFTRDKKQTLAGLFHDIATPVFKHCIDFMNGDSENQESTEELTRELIEKDEKIMELLKRDGISVEEVCDYHIYPVADNDTPHLSADRFEYNFSCGYIMHPEIWDLRDLKECYDDVEILKNEVGEIELGFKHLDIAEKYISIVSKLWPWWICDANRVCMQYLADLCMSMNNIGELTVDDLYTLKESDVLDLFRNSSSKEIREAFYFFENVKECYKTDGYLPDKYTINVRDKRRYINPLVSDGDKYGRVYNLSLQAKKNIDNYMQLPIEGYLYVDYNFVPISEKRKLTMC